MAPRFVAVLALLAGCSLGTVGKASPTDVTDGGATVPGATIAPRSDGPGVVSFISVTSDRVPDVSSLEAWGASFIVAGMSDVEKANAVWRSVVAFRHQDEPPREFLEDTGHVHDPIKLFNVYGYSQCDCASAAVAALGRYVGLDVRGRSLPVHSQPEIAWGNGWHMLDPAYIAQFPKPDGTPASVDELVADVSGWLAGHPDLVGNRDKLKAFAADGGWRNGPPLLSASPYLSADGLLPEHVQGWVDLVGDYSVASPETEFGYTLGYRVNVQLRAGERLVRNFANQGHHINDDLGLACESLTAVPGEGSMAYSPDYGDLAPGRVGNGTHEYEVPLARGRYRDGALDADNLADGDAGVSVADGRRPGILVERMVSSYVVLAGTLKLDAEIKPGGAITISFSRNHGLDWTPIAMLTSSGPAQIDLSAYVRRRYDYRLRFELVGSGTGLRRIHVTDVIQHSQRALPALAAGSNSIHVTTGADEGTITLEGSVYSSETHNLTWRDLHATVDGMIDAPLRVPGRTGSITFPLSTPGPMTRLRFGSFYRARGAADLWEYQVSFDGSTFQTVDREVGPTAGAERYITFDAVPSGARRAWVRFKGTRADTLALFSFRIDADYAEPRGGFAPVAVTYAWKEKGQPRSDRHVVTSPDERYTIECAAPPQLGSITVERPEP